MVEISGIEPLTSCSPCTALSRVSWIFARLDFDKKSTTRFRVVLFFLVEITGIEPVTSCMPCKRSPS